MKNKFIYSILLFVICISNLVGQKGNIIDVSNLPYYNFGKGVGITSPDSLFQFNIRFRIQSRFSYFKNQGDEAAFDGQVRRLRLRFDGFVGNPKFLYVLQLSFAPGDVGEITDGENLNIIRDAIVYYNASKHWNFGFGQTKLPGNRQRVNSSGALQLTDRSINNARFNIDRDFGFFINHFHDKKDQFSWNLKSAITTGDGRNYTKSPDNGLAYTSKLEILPFGKFGKDGAYFEGDQFREPTPKLMISAAYHYNHKAKRQAGVLGSELYESRNLQSIFADAILKYQGYSIMASYMNRNTSDPITMSENGDISRVYIGNGMDFQTSYLFKNNFELIGRYSVIHPDAKIALVSPEQTQYSIGLTKYFWEHAFKVQLEASLDQLDYQNAESDENVYVRFQVEMGI